MLNTTIHLALTDDWELRGNGSGDMAQIQFSPMKKLLSLYDRYKVRATFNAEVMQQLTFRKLQDAFTELRPLADAWDDHVREAFKRGQDIQLHIHPQWSKAQYENGKWTLSGEWSLTKYDPDTAYSMLTEGKQYLENLLRPLNPDYKCVSFRGGSLSIAPSEFLLDLLAKVGITLDTSIVGGLHFNTRNVQIDYTNCEESFLPFYPRMKDARKVSEKPEPITCVPIFHFYLSRHQALRQTLSKGWQKVNSKISSGKKRSKEDDDYTNQEWAEIGRSSTLARIYDKAIKPSLKGKHAVADISQLDSRSMREMLAAIRKMARATGLNEVPVILTNHSKYMKDFSTLEQFLKDVSDSKDIKFVTLTELAEKLQAGEFPIRKAEVVGM